MGSASCKWIFLLLLASSLLLRGCYREAFHPDPQVWPVSNRVLEFDGIPAFIDVRDHILLYSLPSDTVKSFSPRVGFCDYHAVAINGLKLEENEINDLGEVVVNQPYSVVAENSRGSQSFVLYFTSLPLIHVHTEENIRDEPKVCSWTEMQYTGKEDGNGKTSLYASFAGIEFRGRTSANFEKKSYGLELWENSYGRDQSAPLLGMRSGEDWILDAMYIDRLRMRNKLSFEIWEKMWQEKHVGAWQAILPGIQCEFVELFINQRYMGLYCLSEKLDEKLLKLPDGGPGSAGVLYKAIDWQGGATAFKTYNSEPVQSMIWEGWEQIFPENYAYWEPLVHLRKTVVLDNDELFAAKIDSLIDLDCLAEYFIFTNLILAHDNIIKNYYLTRYREESRFLILPWDLEGSLGIMWDGEESSSNGMLENNLFNRLRELEVNEFNELLSSKWENYRASIFQLDSLAAPVIQYAALLKRSGAVERENRRWDGLNIDLDQEFQYLLQWTELRLQYLDLFFD